MDKIVSKILVIESDKVLLDLLKNELCRLGFEIITKDNAVSALEIINKEKFDLILLDYVMPEFSGIDLCRRIKANKEFKEVPIIILTIMDKRNEIEKAFEAGVTDYVIKPIIIDEVILRIKKFLNPPPVEL